ncbi:MAG: hypothetical protein M0Z61_15770 [Nitrospiraceae bacterium]|nr:hypothetical protein [Nitrospiraceae bacterium]
MGNPRGKSFKATARDVSEGYATVNPIFLKPFEAEDLKGLYSELQKCLSEIRAEQFPHGRIEAIRIRNLRLQRLYGASMVMRNYARAKRIIIL